MVRVEKVGMETPAVARRDNVLIGKPATIDAGVTLKDELDIVVVRKQKIIVNY
jgi:hypothetical protein